MALVAAAAFLLAATWDSARGGIGRRRGYHYMIFLDSSINHPNDLGHELFLSGLRAAFEAR